MGGQSGVGGGPIGETSQGGEKRACLLCQESGPLTGAQKEVSMPAVMCPGWKNLEHDLILTSEVPPHEKILNILYGHTCVKINMTPSRAFHSHFLLI